MAYKYPGVYVEEVPGAKTISGVSTDIAAFVGVAEKGEVNVPTLITSWTDFTDKFGGFVWNRYLAFAVYNFFTLGGSQCYVVNTEIKNGKAGSVDITCDKTNFTPEPANGATAKENTITCTGSSAGTWIGDPNATIDPKPDEIRFGIAVSPADAVPDSLLTTSFSFQVLATPSKLSGTTLSSVMIREYIATNDCPVVGEGVYPADAGGDWFDPEETVVLEEFPGFTYTDIAKEDENAPPTPFETRINSGSLFVRVLESGMDAYHMPLPGIYQPTGAKGDSDDLQFTTALTSLDEILDFATVVITDDVDKVTYEWIKEQAGDGNDADEDPKILGFKITDASKMKATVNQLFDEYAAVKWRHAFAVTSSPYGCTVNQVKAFKEGTSTEWGPPINSEWGALYYPWFKFINPYTNTRVWLPPAGPALGIYASTDNLVGVWKAPAGIEFGRLTVAQSMEIDLSNEEQAVLNPIGIDAIRPILTYGNCIYGARTVSLNPEWKYINVRRTAIYIEQSLYFGLQWVVFEPNSPKLWSLVTRDVTTFMNGFWRDGGLFGTSASEAFFVVCDASNNPPETIDQGILYIDVGFAPLKPAEFVVIRLSQIVLTS